MSSPPAISPKIIVMLPLLYFTRKLNHEDPSTVFYTRCAFGTVQSIILLSVIYIFFKIQQIAKVLAKDNVTIYTVQPNPLAKPEDKKKYKKTSLAKHVKEQAGSLILQTIMGLTINVGLHIYRGMIVGLAMQSVMAPFTLYESKLAKALLMSADSGSMTSVKAWKDKRIFDEKYSGELEDGDSIEDAEGNVEVVNLAKAKKQLKEDSRKKTTPPVWKNKSMQEVLLDTWDGVLEETAPLVSKLTKNNINNKTAENEWTPLMVVAGIHLPDVTDAMKKMKELGADPTLTDVEGWNALHWAAFHGSLDAARFLLTQYEEANLTEVKDKEGKRPLDIAKTEKNDAIAALIEGGDKKGQ